jgi:mono/diheme cytochrome c family protein
LPGQGESLGELAVTDSSYPPASSSYPPASRPPRRQGFWATPLAGVIGALIVLLVIGVVGFGVIAWRPAIAAIDPPDAGAFDVALVERGAHLAAIGNCAFCHTAPGGQGLAGGRALPTPFGTIHSTNITPDPQTGIGRWSEVAFIRSMREGVDRDGNHLYPAFPYDHFTLVSDEDNRALYAYLMTRPPVRAEAVPNALAFPLNFRPILAGWKLMFLDEGPYRPDPDRDADWNRGAYLVAGLGHCGACHTPRNAFGAVDRDRFLAGGEAEGWHAYALDASAPAPIPWNADSLAFFLKHGWHEDHGMARGPMAPVIDDLATVPDDDVRAMATYLATLAPQRPAPAPSRPETPASEAPPKVVALASGDSQTVPQPADVNHPGAALYAAACASCHDSGRPLPFGGVDLAVSTALSGPEPRNPINVILDGIPPAEDAPSGTMPGFAGALGETQLVALLEYARERFSDKPRWENLEGFVRDALRARQTSTPERPPVALEPGPAARGTR